MKNIKKVTYGALALLLAVGGPMNISKATEDKSNTNIEATIGTGESESNKTTEPKENKEEIKGEKKTEDNKSDKKADTSKEDEKKFETLKNWAIEKSNDFIESDDYPGANKNIKEDIESYKSSKSLDELAKNYSDRSFKPNDASNDIYKDYEAYTKLKEANSRESRKKLIDEINVYLKNASIGRENYTPKSLLEYASIKLEAQNLIKNPESTDEELKAVSDKLADGYKNILKPVDIAYINGLIGEDVKEEDYTKDSFKNYQDAVAKAKEALKVNTGDREKDLKTYKEAKETLKKAIDSLVRKDGKTNEGSESSDKKDEATLTESKTVNKDKLADAIKNNNKDLDQYTEESKKDMNKALEEAQKVLDNKDSSQEDVDKAVKAIEDAKDKLVKKLDPNASTTSSKIVGNSVDNAPNANTKGSLPQTGEVVLGIVAALAALGAGGFGLYKTRNKKDEK